MSADMYQRVYWEINKVLDTALGTEEEDGAGSGIVADVMLLTHRYQLALKELEAAGKLAAVSRIRQAELPDPFEERAS